MIGVAIALIILGLIVGFIAFPFGFAPGIVGLILLVLALTGFGRRAGSERP